MNEHRFSILQGRAVGDSNLTDPDFRLLAAYGQFGDKDGWCWPAQQTLADIVGKSRKWVNERTQVLVELGYLQKEHRFNPDGGQTSNKYRLVFDLPVTAVGGNRTPRVTDDGGNRTPPVPEVERAGYTNVPLNVPLNDPLVTDVPESFPVEWKVQAGKQVTTLPDNEDAQYKDTAMLISMGFGNNTDHAFAIAYTFMKTRGMIIPSLKIKGQRKAIQEMIEMKVNAAHVEQAVKQLLEKKMTVADLHSVVKTASAIANTPAVVKPKKYTMVGDEEEQIE